MSAKPTVQKKTQPKKRNVRTSAGSIATSSPTKGIKEFLLEGEDKQDIEAKVKADPVFAKYGAPFLPDGSRIVINARAVAAKCAADYTVQYNVLGEHFERFDHKQGLWILARDVEVARVIDRLLWELGKEYQQFEFVQRSSSSNNSSVAKMIRTLQHDANETCLDGLVHVSNGVIDLNGNNPKLLNHDPQYPFRRSSGLKYNPRAGCPQFLDKFLGKALTKNDIALIQMYCGSVLLGGNSCHGILVIRGTPGGGKSTLLTIIEKVIGESKVAHLRTSHLGGRFETSAFLDKSLIVGKDVPGDTLAVAGAKMLKSLVGGDLMQAEIKYNPDKQQLRGDFHVVMVSNSNLKIALDGDHDAWRRRLLVIDFNNPRPAKPIPNFAEMLVEQEGSGILNWLIAGALRYRREMSAHGRLRLSEQQNRRIETLLQDSDNIVEFVKQSVVPRNPQPSTINPQPNRKP